MPASQTLRIGEIAQDLLIPGQNGKVLAVFSQSAYLVTGQEELVYLTSAEAPMHPRSLQLSGAFPRLMVGSLFSVNDSHLHIEPSFTLDLHQALLWRADQVSTADVEEIIDIPAKVKAIFTSLDVGISVERTFDHDFVTVSLLENVRDRLFADAAV